MTSQPRVPPGKWWRDQRQMSIAWSFRKVVNRFVNVRSKIPGNKTGGRRCSRCNNASVKSQVIYFIVRMAIKQCASIQPHQPVSSRMRSTAAAKNSSSFSSLSLSFFHLSSRSTRFLLSYGLRDGIPVRDAFYSHAHLLTRPPCIEEIIEGTWFSIFKKHRYRYLFREHASQSNDTSFSNKSTLSRNIVS